MKTLEWLNNEIIPNNLICDEVAKVDDAKSKKQIYEVACGAKGLYYLPEMQLKNKLLSYDIIVEEFGRYINGKYKPEIKNSDKAFGYTSCIYCNHDDEVVVDTTGTCLLNCRSEVSIAPHHHAQIYADSNCKLTVHCPDSSSVLVTCFGDAHISADDSKSNIKIKRIV